MVKSKQSVAMSDHVAGSPLGFVSGSNVRLLNLNKNVAVFGGTIANAHID